MADGSDCLEVTGAGFVDFNGIYSKRTNKATTYTCPSVRGNPSGSAKEEWRKHATGKSEMTWVILRDLKCKVPDYKAKWAMGTLRGSRAIDGDHRSSAQEIDVVYSSNSATEDVEKVRWVVDFDLDEEAYSEGLKEGNDGRKTPEVKRRGETRKRSIEHMSQAMENAWKQRKMDEFITSLA